MVFVSEKKINGIRGEQDAKGYEKRKAQPPPADQNLEKHRVGAPKTGIVFWPVYSGSRVVSQSQPWRLRQRNVAEIAPQPDAVAQVCNVFWLPVLAYAGQAMVRIKRKRQCAGKISELFQGFRIRTFDQNENKKADNDQVGRAHERKHQQRQKQA